MNKLSKRDINRYLKEIKKQLLLTHSSKEASAILEMIQTSIFEFIEDNPTATLETLKLHFNDYTAFNDIELYNTDSTILEDKLNYSKTLKKGIRIVICVAIIILLIYIALCIKTYINIQNSIDAYKVIEII